jgi:hypothetical protein
MMERSCEAFEKWSYQRNGSLEILKPETGELAIVSTVLNLTKYWF